MDKNRLMEKAATDPEVRMLHTAYINLTKGLRISYAEVAALISSPVYSPRWRRVTQRWRNQVFRERNILIGCEPGECFIVLDESQRLDTGARRCGFAMRSMMRANTVIATTDTAQLSPEEQQRQAHWLRVNARLGSVYAEQRRLLKSAKLDGE